MLLPFLFVSCLIRAVSTTVVHHGSILTVGEISYYVSPQPVAKFPASKRITSELNATGDLLPLTIVDVSGIGNTDIKSILASFLEKDDVLNEEFLRAIFLKSTAGHVWFNSSSFAAPAIIIQERPNEKVDLPAGPYILSKATGCLHIPYRLYSDIQSSFAYGIVPRANGSFSIIPASLPGASAVTVGVPSRLYYQPTPERPLAGVRLGVKDLYDLKGVKTGAGSRAFYDLYPEANTTAPAIQRLIDAGAVVIGKMKTTQFAMPELASLAIDYQAPFNPRGDGYQDPGSSSSGPGAGLASYEWLDLAIGSDTGGSLRVPANSNGLYGNCPTHGLVELTNVVPLAPEFDTAGFLARDPSILQEAARGLYANASELITNYTTYPSHVQTFGLPTASAPNLTMSEVKVLAFVDKLVEFLSADSSTLNYTSRWAKNPPAGASGDLEDFLGYTWLALSAKRQIDLVRKPLFQHYAAKYNGREPFVNPVAKKYWDWGLTFNQTIDDAVSRKTTFMHWWNREIMPRDTASCSGSLGIYISANALGVQGEPAYRYTQSGNLPLVSGLLGGLFIAPFSEVVDVVVPIGQAIYLSDVTNREEHLPVTVNIMAAKGCDLMVLDLINDLIAAGLLSPVQTGSSISGGMIYV